MDELCREGTGQEERPWLPITLAPERQQFPALQVTVAETMPPSLGLSSVLDKDRLFLILSKSWLKFSDKEERIKTWAILHKSHRANFLWGQPHVCVQNDAHKEQLM